MHKVEVIIVVLHVRGVKIYVEKGKSGQKMTDFETTYKKRGRGKKNIAKVILQG
jgi:hypothetical protein